MASYKYSVDKNSCLSIPCLRYAFNGNISELKKLVEGSQIKESVVNFSFKNSGDTPLIMAAQNGHVDILNYLLDMQCLIEHKNLDGKTALHEAAIHGQLESVKILLRKGANVDSLKRADWTPLMLACSKNNLAVIEALVEAGAELNRRNKDGWNSFHIAVREGHPDIVNYLLTVAPSCWNNTSKNQRTPLHTAATHGRTDCVDLLIISFSFQFTFRSGFVLGDIWCAYESDMKDSCESTPLMDALRFNHVDVAELLVNKHKASISATDQLGRQSIHLAAMAGSIQSLTYLLQHHNVAVSCRVISNESTPLHFAAKEGQLDAVKFLLENGAILTALDKNGRAALHLASAGAKREVVKYLLQECGAKCQPDMFMKNPCELAMDPNTFQLFEDQGSAHSCRRVMSGNTS